MDLLRTSSVHPPEAESGAPEASPPHTPPLSVDSAMDSSDDCSVLSLGEVPISWVEPNACVKEVVSDPEISPQDVGVLLPFCCQEAPTAHLPTITTTYLETSQQDNTGLPSATRSRFGKRLTNIFSSMFSCFRSRDRVVVLVGEADTLHWLDINNPKPVSEPVPAAKRGCLQRFLRRFRRTSRKG
ncbi:apoptosis-inducing factor 1, mitochondrial isoform X1 [Astyanax mexicanus]|uniref:Apoptosis-inducing factor 1, mitochondrial isoform X1 n=1 Tax=Astyanax mexicanus TaxID=7994 RepID=A0A8T2MNM5_ASTMX|nr:apoptosis-inducing factor 1, mitochondrial isoform X1 [Astyanax mexicanus]